MLLGGAGAYLQSYHSAGKQNALETAACISYPVLFDCTAKPCIESRTTTKA